MANFLKDIQRIIRTKCNCEPIEGAVISGHGGIIPDNLMGKPVCFGDIREYFDYEYDDGFGGAECHAIYLYTRNFIVFVSEYDGATSVDCIPRNPTECTPKYL